MEEQQQHSNPYGDPITLDEIVVWSSDFMRSLLRRWWVFLLLFTIIGGYLIYKAVKAPVKYRATYTFMRDEDESNSMSGVSSILGQFGIGGNRGKFNLDRVVELARSRRIVQGTLFDTAYVAGRNDLLANHIIDVYNLPDKWAEEDESYLNFRFGSTTVEDFSTEELLAIKTLYEFVIGEQDGKGLVSVSYSEQSTILSLNATTKNESLSIELINSLYANLSEYYISKATERQQQTYSIVKSKADSIQAILSQAEADYARFRDQNQNLYSNVARLEADRLERNIQKLNIIHGEALKNQEIADFSLRNATPVIRELDRPIPPLDPIEKSLIRAILSGVIVTLFLGVILIVFLNLMKRVRTILSDRN